jgi:hypothetical protein
MNKLNVSHIPYVHCTVHIELHVYSKFYRGGDFLSQSEYYLPRRASIVIVKGGKTAVCGYKTVEKTGFSDCEVFTCLTVLF